MINQGSLVMPHNLLILGGTTEASSLAQSISKTDIKATISYAGRVERIRQQPIPKRIGGFGGVSGLVSYLHEHQVTHVIDATHPFASQMSENAIAACREANVPLAAFTRPAWQAQAGDKWSHVPDIAAAAAALSQAPRRVMLAIGRMHLAAFYDQSHHFYLLRLVDAPEAELAFPNKVVEVSRGPFTTEDDKALMSHHQIDLVVAKNAGGKGAYAKIEAARALDIEVMMIDRPVISPRTELSSLPEVHHWLSAKG